MNNLSGVWGLRFRGVDMDPSTDVNIWVVL